MKTPRKCRTLGLLDMYGFEASDSGGFESLVFNFATEKVQNVISERSLVIEQQEYSIEGVEWTNFDSIADNSHIVTLLERGSYGVFSILDEVCTNSNNLVMQPPISSTQSKKLVYKNSDKTSANTLIIFL
jgi:myosin heavy subunit